mmetsp:Transcript_74722/g.139489  ORF Transcript_74722/g.139489 Transcript_74722/m.139489 type:complete len:137 (+) Transcript_74722:2-412(+)
MNGTASVALDHLSYMKAENELAADLYCTVQAALIPAYEPLGLDCDKVGTWKDLPSSVQCSNLPACPTTPALPQGLASYDFTTDTTPGSNVDCGYALPSDSTTTTLVEGGGDDMTSSAVVQSLATAVAAFVSMCLGQ